MDRIQPRLDLLKLLARVGQIVQHRAQLVGCVLRGIGQLLHLLTGLRQLVGVAADTRKCACGLGDESRRTVGGLIAIECANGALQRKRELFRVLQRLSARL